MDDIEYFKCECGYDGFYSSTHEMPTKRLMMCAKCKTVYDMGGNRVEIELITNGKYVSYKER